MFRFTSRMSAMCLLLVGPSGQLMHTVNLFSLTINFLFLLFLGLHLLFADDTAMYVDSDCTIHVCYFRFTLKINVQCILKITVKCIVCFVDNRRLFLQVHFIIYNAFYILAVSLNLNLYSRY